VARGHLVQRAAHDRSSWRLVVELEPDPATGNRRQKTATFHGAKRDAEAELARLVLAARSGQLGLGGRLTVADLLERYAAAAPEAKTRRGYRQLARNQLAPLIGRVLLEKLSPLRVDDLRAELALVRRRDRPDEVIATSTQLKAFRLLHAALAQAVRWRLIALNPAAGVRAPRATTKEIRPLSGEQAAAFVDALDREQLFWRALFLVALSTGMRLAELCGLRWTDCKLDRGVLEVAQTIAYVTGEGSSLPGEKGRVTKPRAKSRAGGRALPIDQDLVALLREHRRVQVARQLHAGPLFKDADLVFPGPFGRPLDDSPIRARLTAVCRAAGVPRITPHDLRHTMATLMLLDGVNVKVVSERLGHATVAITMQTYAHVLPGLQEDAAERFARLVRAAPASARER
jgi:integrase